jgi:hypothetical protein
MTQFSRDNKPESKSLEAKKVNTQMPILSLLP